MRVVVLPDADRLASYAATTVAALLETSGEDRVSLALAGGGTPRATYDRLRALPVRWDRVDVWLGDERWVEPEHEDSNARMAREALADHVDATFHTLPWSEELTPEEAASHYDDLLRRFMPVVDDVLRPDIVLLGLGDDGHTASLFPDSEALDVEDRHYVAHYVPAKNGWRLTATYPLLAAARHIVFIVSGAGKAEALAGVLEDPNVDLPARELLQRHGDTIWLVDEGAASRLHSTPLERVR